MKEKGKNHGKKKIIIIISIIFAIVICGGIYGNWYYNILKLVNKDTIYEGIYIQNINVGGMAKEEAQEKLKSYLQADNKNKKIILNYKDKNWIMTYEDWGFETDYKEIVNKAYEIGRNGSIFERYNIIKGLQQENQKYEIRYTYNETKIYEILNNLKKNFSKQSKNAIIQRINNKFVITDEVIGLELDVQKSKEKIEKKLNAREEGKVELVVKEYKPVLTRKVLSKIEDELGEFSTSFNANGSGRQTNLEIASKKINGSLVMPNEVFSVNNAIGPVNAANGYKQAPIILNGKLVPGFGGGICQIATTLYNAVLYSELKIVERRNHSLPVGYVPLGRDATISGSQIDFKFRNNTSYPIYIESYITNGKLYAKIYGNDTRPKNRKISFEHAVIQVIMPPPERVLQDNKLENGKKIIELNPKKGYKVKLYKNIYKDGKLVNREVANFSYYRPRSGEVRVGTKESVNKLVESSKADDKIND